MEKHQIDNDIGICLYLKDVNDFLMLVNFIDKIDMQQSANKFIKYEWDTNNIYICDKK